MNRTIFSGSRFLAVLIVSLLFSTPAFAKKEDHGDGNQKHEQKHEQKYDHKNKQKNNQHRESNDGSDINVNVNFGNNQRLIIRDYYNERGRAGRCPPGLAKKHNGCMPPGQAKKWQMGRPLPRGMVYYDLPPRVLAQIGAPPAGHRYIRVAADILLISIGTSMVVDAIENFGRI